MVKMAARESGNGCGSSNFRKRKSAGEGCGQEFPGDPPTDGAVTLPDGFLGVIVEDPSSVRANTSSFKGVSVSVVIEIKRFNCKRRENFYTTITVPDDVDSRKAVAAIVHDLVRLYWDPEHPAKGLNVTSVEIWIRREKLPAGCYIGKGLLDKFVLDKRATLPYAPREGWVGLDAKELRQLKDAIKAQGLDFFKILQADIAKERSQGGRLREEENQIPAAIEEDEPTAEDSEKDLDQLNLNEQVTSLEVKNAALEAKNAALEAKNAALEAKNAASEAKNAASEAKNAALEAKNAALEAKNAASEAKNAALEAKNAASEAKNAALEAKNAALEAKNAALEAKDAALEAEVKSLKKMENNEAITSLFRTMSESPAPGANLPAFSEFPFHVYDT